MINRIFSSKYVLPISQIFTLAIFILLIYGSIGITTDDASFAKILRNTNLANLIVWSYWWPMIIVTAIFFGRFWCTICPMELITSLLATIGLRKRPGSILKSGWVITSFYTLILIIGIHSLAIHRIPMYMAFYMITLLIAAIIVGLIWEKRTFCTYVCPIGHLLGLYSLLSFKKLRVKSADVCSSCKTKDCISTKSHYNFTARSCTSELFPPKITHNKDCILCGQCFKSCSKDNIAIQKQAWSFDFVNTIKLRSAEIAFFMLISGFVVYEILSEWSVSKHILMYIPNLIFDTFLIPKQYQGGVKALILFIIMPTIFYSIFVFAKKYIAKESTKLAFAQLVLSLLPITASLHLLKATLKTTSRIPYWKYALTDTDGIESAKLIIDNPELIKGNHILEALSSPIAIIAIVLPFIGLLASLYIIKKQNLTNNKSRIISILASLIYASLFIITIYFWKLH